ncbi:MAG: helix-turn-helix domain-containing protein [Clostridia bacterium]|nr:helix-turn-helix domain-containing protein [Clostridia bacterium]MBQ7121888.1 helix-turn-helix domain-containing protein [Clostridia bacterium]
MRKKQKTQEVRAVFPSREEIRAAQLACCGRCCNQCESPAEYAWRKRDVDMAILLEKAIENELTETEREAVRRHWFDFESVTAIAQGKGINPSAVKRTLERAQDKLEKVLRYAVFYQNEQKNENIVPLVLGRARVIAAARNAKGGSSGDRITRLRQSQNLTKEILAPALDMSVKRLGELENDAVPDGDELAVMSEFFGVTADFILKGESNE